MGMPAVERLEGDDALPHRKPILDVILAFNREASGISEPALPLALVVRESGTDAVSGGLYGISYYHWLFIDLLVVPKAHRGAGLGTLLMRQAEQVALDRGCIGVWLDTFSFQAQGFYEKLGYEVFASMDDYPPGQSRFWLKKRFSGVGVNAATSLLPSRP